MVSALRFERSGPGFFDSRRPWSYFSATHQNKRIISSAPAATFTAGNYYYRRRQQHNATHTPLQIYYIYVEHDFYSTNLENERGCYGIDRLWFIEKIQRHFAKESWNQIFNANLVPRRCPNILHPRFSTIISLNIKHLCRKISSSIPLATF